MEDTDAEVLEGSDREDLEPGGNSCSEECNRLDIVVFGAATEFEQNLKGAKGGSRGSLFNFIEV